MVDHRRINDVVSCPEAKVLPIEAVEVTWPDGSRAILRHCRHTGWEFVEPCPHCGIDRSRSKHVLATPRESLLEVFELELGGVDGPGAPLAEPVS